MFSGDFPSDYCFFVLSFLFYFWMYSREEIYLLTGNPLNTRKVVASIVSRKLSLRCACLILM